MSTLFQVLPTQEPDEPFNRRISRSRGLVFRQLVEQAIVTGPVTDADVTHGYEW